jgi:hypothetical protein
MSDINNSGDDLTAYLLAEFRCAARRAKLAADDFVAIGLALKGGLITPYQAVMHIEETDAFRFLGRLPGDNWGPEWAESARRYHEDRERSAPKLSRDPRGHTTGPLGVALDLICGEGER